MGTRGLRVRRACGRRSVTAAPRDATVGRRFELGPALWIGAVCATIAAATVSVVTVSVVIWVNQNRIDTSQLRAVVSVALVGAIFNACVGLVAVEVLWSDARGGIL